MKKLQEIKQISSLIKYFEINKHRKGIWFILLVNILFYLTSFPLGILMSLVWWLYVANKIEIKTVKKVSMWVVGIITFFMLSYVYLYVSDEQPSLSLIDVEANQITKASTFDLSGNFEPHSFSVDINDKRIETEGGHFNYLYPLEVGENKIVVKVSNYKYTKKEIIIIRELSLEEIAQKEERENKELENIEKEVVEIIFTQNQALEKVKNYKIRKNLHSPEIPEGSTLIDVYEIKGKIPAIKNLGWFIEKIDNDKYIVSYKQQLNSFEINPRWEVSKDEIKALNGKAITITPELGSQQNQVSGTEFEKLVHETAFKLYNQYLNEYDVPTVEQLDEIEQKSITETAVMFSISEDKVIEIFTRLEAQKYR